MAASKSDVIFLLWAHNRISEDSCAVEVDVKVLTTTERLEVVQDHMWYMLPSIKTWCVAWRKPTAAFTTKFIAHSQCAFHQSRLVFSSDILITHGYYSLMTFTLESRKGNWSHQNLPTTWKPRTMKKLQNGVENEFQVKIEPPYLKDHKLRL